MNKKKPNKKPKGLTDTELIKKYEAPGKGFKQVVKAMVNMSSPTAPEKTDKQYFL